jgi:rhodanese-related sulfurtransferase
MKYGYAALPALMLIAAVSLFADDKVADITHADLVKAVKEGKVVLIDCNGSDSYKSGHIPGAVDFEADKAKLAEKLPADKGALVVAYCGNEECNAYRSGAEAAVKLGYTNVKHYPAGISGWKKSGEQVAAAK